MADGKFVKGLRICKICGRDFPLIAEEAYIARDNERVGIVNAIENKEVTIYDAIDCPHCGAQNILQERKRFADVEDVFDEYEEDPDGCDGCAYEEQPGDMNPCDKCARNHEDWYIKGEEDGAE